MKEEKLLNKIQLNEYREWCFNKLDKTMTIKVWDWCLTHNKSTIEYYITNILNVGINKYINK